MVMCVCLLLYLCCLICLKPFYWAHSRFILVKMSARLGILTKKLITVSLRIDQLLKCWITKNTDVTRRSEANTSGHDFARVACQISGANAVALAFAPEHLHGGVKIIELSNYLVKIFNDVFSSFLCTGLINGPAAIDYATDKRI